MKSLRRWLRRLARYCVFIFLGSMLLFSGLLWYTTTDSFQQLVRGRLISDLERATGGRVELGRFHVIPLQLQVEVRDLTVHGRESASELPYFRVDSLVATVNLSSALGAKIGFHSLILNHPVSHVIFYPDGSSNQPTPKQKSAADFEQLFSVSIDRLDLRRGELLFQDQHLSLDLSSNDISASMYYSFLHGHYSGNLAIGKAETRFDGYRPVAWSGKANFTIDRNGIDFKDLDVISAHSELQLSGAVTNLRAPTIKGSYNLSLDLSQAAAVSRQLELKGGLLLINGSASWSEQTFSSSGKVGVRDFAWQDKNVSAKNASASGKFSLDPQKLMLSQIEGQFLRGSFTGEAEVSNWQTQPKRARSPKTEQQGTIKIKAKDFSLAEIIASLGPQFRLVNKLKFSGDVSGPTEIRWRDSIRNAETTVALDAARPTRTQTGQIPLTGSTHATYQWRSDELTISDLAANTAASQVRASGALGASAPLRISIETTDLREWQPVTHELFPQGTPFNVHGRAVFNGTATQRRENVAIAGNLQLQDFELSIVHAGVQKVHWDSAAVDLQVSPHNLSLHNGVFRHGGAIVKIDGSADLVAWNPAPAAPFRFHVEVQNADAAELATLSGYDHSISGKLAGAFDVSGTRDRPQGRGTFNLLQSSVDGYPFDSASASLELGGSELTFKNVVVANGTARVTGNGAYDWSSQRLQLALSGTNFDLTQFPQLQRTQISIAGKLDFSAHASGTLQVPDVNADLHFRNLSLNGEVAGDYLLNATAHGPDLSLTGHSEFKNAELLLDGKVELKDRWPARIDLHFARLDVDSFLQSYLHGHVTGHSTVAGDLLLQGPLRNPRELSLIGNLTDIYADVENVKLRNDGPIRFNVTDRSLKLESFHVLGDSTDFSGSGSMQFAAERTLDFRVSGKVGLQLLHAYNPDFASSGTLTAEAQVSGTLDTPQVRGKLQLENAAISDINLPSALSEINGTLVFNQNQITIESLSAKTGGGTVTLAGHAELARRLVNFDLTANAEDVRLRYPAGVSSTASANLRWSGSSIGSLLAGDLTITKLGFTPGFDFGTYLERSAQISSLPQTDPVLNKVRLDLHVVTTPELQMQTSVMRLQGEADLHVRGNAAKPVVLGRADVFEGEAYFNTTKYRLERGGVTFNNPAVTTPFLDLEATTHVRDYDITLSLTGPADKPKMNYRSEPPLPPPDIIALLAFGQTSEESAQLQQSSQSAFSQQASNAMLAAALNATLNNRTQRLFGNSRIKIDPQGLATETSPTQSGPAVTIEQQVKDNLTLTYTTNVAQTSQQVIRAEYNVTRNISVVAIRDQNGVVSFDVKIRRRKR